MKAIGKKSQFILMSQNDLKTSPYADSLPSPFSAGQDPFIRFIIIRSNGNEDHERLRIFHSFTNK